MMLNVFIYGMHVHVHVHVHMHTCMQTAILAYMRASKASCVAMKVLLH